MALVELVLPALPAHVRTARLVGVAAARRAGLDDEFVDELRLALGEACGRAVLLHARFAPDTPVEITLRDDPAGLTVTVRDRGPALTASEAATGGGGDAGTLLADATEDDDDPSAVALGSEVALAVVRSLVDEATVDSDTDGTTVTMRWPLPPRLAGVGSTSLATERRDH